MNFDEFDKILDQLDMTSDEKDTAEFILSETAQFAQRHNETAYLVPFGFINFSLMADSFMSIKHPAFENRESKFNDKDFPELDYGETENQPSLASAFADFLNVSYASILHEQIGILQRDDLVDVLFENDKFKYSLKDETMKDEFGAVVEYANIFL